MSLHHLRIFLAVYQELSITKAARRLYVSQPAISKYIQEIETAYAQKLFERSSRALNPTPFGEEFYHYATRVIALYDEMNEVLSPENYHERSLRVGVVSSVGEYIMPQLICRHYGPQQQIRVSVCVTEPEKMLTKLLDNSMDFAITESLIDSPYITNIPIHQEHLVAIACKDDPLAQKRTVTAEDFIGKPILFGEVSRPSMEAWFEQHHVPITPLWQSNSVNALVNAVAMGLGISFLSWAYVKWINDPNVVVLNVEDLQIPHYTYVHHKKGKELSAGMGEFLERYLAYIRQ